MGLTRNGKKGSVRRATSSEGYDFIFFGLHLELKILMVMNGFYTYGNRFGSASTYSNTSSFGSLADLGNDNGVDDLGNISVVVR